MSILSALVHQRNGLLLPNCLKTVGSCQTVLELQMASISEFSILATLDLNIIITKATIALYLWQLLMLIISLFLLMLAVKEE